MTEHIRRAGQVAWAGVGIATLLLVLGYLAWFVRVIWPPLILAGAIVFILNPVVTGLRTRGVPRALGAAIAYLGILAFMALAVLALRPIVSNQVDALRDDWPDVKQKVEDWIDERAEDSEGTTFEFTRQELYDAFSESDLSLSQQIDRIRDIGVKVFHVLLILILGPIIAFYLLVDLPHLRRVADSLIPDRARPEVYVVGRRLARAIGGFFRGQLFVALIVGIMCSIGLLIIGLDFWLLVGMIAGVFNMIPLIGPWIGGVPGVIIALTTADVTQALLVVAVMAGAQQIDNHFITPFVMQRAVKLHPAAVILALVAGGTIFGFAGLILAVPTAAVLKIVVGHLWRVHVLGEPLEQVIAAFEAQDAAAGDGMVEDVVDFSDEPSGAADARPTAPAPGRAPGSAAPPQPAP
jgi:predicted PurR-regulated permease PerM